MSHPKSSATQHRKKMLLSKLSLLGVRKGVRVRRRKPGAEKKVSGPFL